MGGDSPLGNLVITPVGHWLAPVSPTKTWLRTLMTTTQSCQLHIDWSHSSLIEPYLVLETV
jgi:hypothetical protein